MDAHLLKPLPLREVLAIGAQAERNLLPGRLHADNRAKVLLLAIGLQESDFQHRVQIGGGQGRGFWQFERGGGVKGVLGHEATWRYAGAACLLAGVSPVADLVHRELALNDQLAWAFARLLLFAHPKSLPALGDPQGAWEYYRIQWRPGHPRPDDWRGNYAQALAAVMT